MENYQFGYFRYKPHYIIDKKTGKSTKFKIYDDIMVPESKPGYKAGNSLIDENLESSELERKIKKLEE
ncbi:hypothetical protein HOA59_00810 [archaeon]|jgi:hypothetical protein|nr:hypothetical protein [archaeon]MBT6823960.1 hypothetical protein [archaeon]MBT7107190.1 hypothetical protein [archaeon]MBT7297740.1 hypothetical protein [archaeon]